MRSLPKARAASSARSAPSVRHSRYVRGEIEVIAGVLRRWSYRYAPPTYRRSAASARGRPKAEREARQLQRQVSQARYRAGNDDEDARRCRTQSYWGSRFQGKRGMRRPRLVRANRGSIHFQYRPPHGEGRRSVSGPNQPPTPATIERAPVDVSYAI